MTELLPLRETSANPLARALLRSADRDEPSPRALAKTAAALGVAATLLGTAGNTSAAVAGNAAVTCWATLLKPLLIGAAGGLVVALSAHRLSAPSEQTKSPTAVPAVAAAPSPTHPAFSEPHHASETAPSPIETPPREPPLRSSSPLASRPSGASEAASKASSETSRALPSAPLDSASATAAPPAAPGGSVSIASELANVDRARQALRERRAADALHELDVYRVSWAGGVLATEAAVLRIEAHLALGDRTSAVHDARAFLAANPSGRYAARVRALFKPAELE